MAALRCDLRPTASVRSISAIDQSAAIDAKPESSSGSGRFGGHSVDSGGRKSSNRSWCNDNDRLLLPAGTEGSKRSLVQADTGDTGRSSREGPEGAVRSLGQVGAGCGGDGEARDYVGEVRQSVKRAASRVGRSPSPEPRRLKRGRQSECSTAAAPPAANHLKAARKKPLTTPTDVVSEQIRKIYSSCRQTDDTYRKKIMLLDRVNQLLAGNFQWFQLHVVGSTCTGFACDSSDMDVCLYVSDVWIDQATRAKRILSRVRSLILEEFDFRVVLIHAKVPILRCTYVSTGIKMDLNCNNIVGIRNTHLLRCYSQIDDRVSPLIVVVKLWAQSHDINDASRCTLSSYSLALMVIHFLQYGAQPAVLPNLQRLFQQRFSPSQPVSSIPKHDRPYMYRSSNSASLSDLFTSFLRYYSADFDFSVHVASVRTGTRLYKYQCAQQEAGGELFHGGWKYICVEEPFTRLNTARAVHDLLQFQRIVSVFSSSYSILRNQRRLRGVFGAQVDGTILRLI